MRKSFLPVLFILLLGLASCGDEQADVTPPSLDLVSIDPKLKTLEICGNPDEQSLRLSTRDTLQITLDIQDDGGLSQLKLDIHQNFDCHGHGGQAPGFSIPDRENATTDWERLQLIELDGVEEEFFLQLVPPTNGTAGNYHLSFRALDLSGNESSFDQIYNVVLQNSADTTAPQLTLNAFPQAAATLNRGDNYDFSGFLSDNQILSNGGNALVFLTYRPIDSEIWVTGPFQPMTAEELTETFTLNFIPPTTITKGSYEIAVWGFDGVRNIALSWKNTYEIE